MGEVYCPKCHKSDKVIKRGKNRLGKQQFYCKNKKCKQWFSETTDTVFNYRHFSKEEIIKICYYIIEGKSIRTIATLTHHNKDTIARLLDFMATNAREINEILPNTDYYKNKFWFNIKKRKRKLSDSAKEGLIKIRKGTSRYVPKKYRYNLWFEERV